jgi:hypothetical protein
MKKISPLSSFFFKEKHPEIDGNKLFKSQTQLAVLAVKTKNTSFFGKTPNGIRPFINQQMKENASQYSKPIRNHYETYKNILLARIGELGFETTSLLIEKLLKKYDEIFQEHQHKSKKEPFEFISAQTLSELAIVAKSFGGKLSFDDFCKCIKNLEREEK